MNTTYIRSRISNLYKQEKINSNMFKKKVNITIDNDLCEVIEDIRSEEKFKPSFSQVINDFLKEIPDIKKRLKKK